VLQLTESIFQCTREAAVPVYDVSTYSYFGQAQNAVHPAYVNLTGGSATIAAAGGGTGTKRSSGRGAWRIGDRIGDDSRGRPRGYGTTPTYLALDLKFALGASSGPQHFVFSLGSNVFVLPSALKLVSSDPPSISSVDTDGNGNVVVTGSNFASGQPGLFRRPAGSYERGRTAPTPPPSRRRV